MSAQLDAEAAARVADRARIDELAAEVAALRTLMERLRPPLTRKVRRLLAEVVSRVVLGQWTLMSEVFEDEATARQAGQVCRTASFYDSVDGFVFEAGELVEDARAWRVTCAGNPSP